MIPHMRTWFSLLVIVLLVGAAGCKSKTQTAQKPGEAPKQTAAAVSTAPAVTKQDVKVEKEVYVYDDRNRRDPFIPLVTEVREKAQRKKGASPIEDFDVEEIKLIAIAWDSRQYYAMITLPDRKSYTVRKGTTLGLYGGKVEVITKDSVVIREQVKDYKGQTKTKDTILRLRKEGD